MRFLRRLQRLWSLTAVVEWPCRYCGCGNETSMILWNTVRYTLICDKCTYQQNYPDWIRQFDPLRRPMEREVA